MDLMKYDDIAELIPVSHTTLYKWSKTGKFPARVIISERISGWRREDVYNWIEEKGLTIDVCKKA